MTISKIISFNLRDNRLQFFRVLWVKRKYNAMRRTEFRGYVHGVIRTYRRNRRLRSRLLDFCRHHNRRGTPFYPLVTLLRYVNRHLPRNWEKKKDWTEILCDNSRQQKFYLHIKFGTSAVSNPNWTGCGNCWYLTCSIWFNAEKFPSIKSVSHWTFTTGMFHFLACWNLAPSDFPQTSTVLCLEK